MSRSLSTDRNVVEDPDREEIKSAFESAWQPIRASELARNTSRLRKSLSSTSQIERDSAGIYLKALGLSE
jgi:hypothetical protein